MPSTPLDTIPHAPKGKFPAHLSMRRTMVTIPFHVENGILIYYSNRYHPIGYTREESLLRGNKTIVVLFEDEHGNRTWGHAEER